MIRTSLIASTVALALALAAGSAQAAPSIAAIKKEARKQIRADAKAYLKQQGYTLERPSVRVTFEPVRCGTPPVTIRAKASICTMQTAWPIHTPNAPKVRRPFANGTFDATGAMTGSQVSVTRQGPWQIMYYALRGPR
jgi:hypothetical protein